ncbi:glycosyltransferase family 4 protein [Vibrio maritimus]|uniref:glycosyltransferase family 4 protein n=1 Tax=Vibrio maritimus TaxID=990268 RepID=UPI001F32B4FE|nr:glycosyltransferase family 4 protein [Vibrio maritimus]
MAVSEQTSVIESLGYVVSFIPTHSNKWSKLRKLFAIFYSGFFLRREIVKEDVNFIWFHGGEFYSLVRKYLILSFATFLLKKKPKVILSLHSPTIENMMNSRIKKVFLSHFIKRSDCTTVVSSWWKEYIESYLPISNLFVLNNVVQSVTSETEKVSNIERFNSRKVLFMSRLVEGKGAEVVVEVAKMLPQYSFSIAGDGPLLTTLKNRVTSLKLTNVNFLGWISDRDKAEVINSSAIFFLPSKRDSFGMGYIECMAHGVPVIGLDYKAIPSIISQGGMLVNPFNCVESSASAIHALLSDLSKYNCYASAALELSEKYSPKAIAPALKEILR